MDNINSAKRERKFIGTVVSAVMQKTVVAKVETMKLHSKYNKFYKVSKKYHVHDAKGEAKIGDEIKFVECRPLSKTKRWRLTEILK